MDAQSVNDTVELNKATTLTVKKNVFNFQQLMIRQQSKQLNKGFQPH